MTAYPEAALDAARDYVFSRLGTVFDEDEQLALQLFFTNLDRRVFFMHGLPPNIGATLLAMFSRLKNPRGLRGVFVDAFLPQLLAAQLSEVEEQFGGNEATFLRERRLSTLTAFLRHSPETKGAFKRFLEALATDPEYLTTVADSKKARTFLATWLDKYGHNSIARMAGLWICFEGISLLATKTLEWNRPGSGYIELSTRYVDMSAKGCYPISRELGTGWIDGADAQAIEKSVEEAFALYGELAGKNFDGPFPTFLRERYRAAYADAPKDLETGVIGETCDVLGNLLPASTLTSVGVHVSGEAFPTLLKHLLLDDTPENRALVELLLEECPKVGGHQFARHYVPTPWERTYWQYLSPDAFRDLAGKPQSTAELLMSYDDDDLLDPVLRLQGMFEETIPEDLPRGDHDKLPAEWEAVTVAFKGIMSFRGWRDLQRQGFCTHFRTLLTPSLGFYEYDKPGPAVLHGAFRNVAETSVELSSFLQKRGVPRTLCQYPLPIGHRIGFVLMGNLRQLEFCNWQRTGFSVNHEVRQVFLAMEESVRRLCPLWGNMSRADTIPAYIFARGSVRKSLPCH